VVPGSGGVEGDGLRRGRGCLGHLWCAGRDRAGEGCGCGAFGVGGRGRAGAYGDAVDPVEVGDGFGLGGVDAGDLPEVVLAVEVDVAAVLVGADRDDGVPVVGVQVDGEAAGGDVVVNLLGRGAHFTDFTASEPGHGVVAPGPLGVDLLLEGGLDRGPVTVSGEVLGGPGGVVGLLPVDPGQHHHSGPGRGVPEAVAQEDPARGGLLRAGQCGCDRRLVAWVEGEVDMDGGGGAGHRVLSVLGHRPVRTVVAGFVRGERGPARAAVDVGAEVAGRVACCQRARTAVRSARARRLPVTSWWTLLAGSSV
jgi:hypothetical protein